VALELRILGGARAGQREVFEKSVIAVGRHPLSDLRFDPEKDLDVSTKHAEIRGVGGRYTIHDNTSTNGTFVNGQRVLPERELHDGDRIAFGEHGPQVEVRIVASAPVAAPAATRMHAASPAPSAAPIRETPRRSTTERIAIAVQEHTSRLTKLLVAAVVVLGAGIGIAFWLGHRTSEAQVQQLQQMLAQNESASTALNQKLQAMAGSDTGYVRALERQSDSLRRRVESSPSASAGTIDSLRAALRSQNALLNLNVPSINARNAPAVAILYSEIDNQPYAGTAFAVTRDGLLATNRHNVQNADGTRATRLAVTFRDTKDVLPAHIVKVSDDPAVDLALVQLDRPGPFPTVAGISPAPADAPEGAPVVTIGFPLGPDLVMEGTGANMVAKTTLDPGTVSKRVSTVLQVDSYAAHGSSGSPVFNAMGNVVGVVYGGPPGGGGRIVYAVPADKLAAFLPPEAAAIIR
jgi:S1-C subfamily serine protease